jgi:hypothetical protein
MTEVFGLLAACSSYNISYESIRSEVRVLGEIHT